MRVLAVLILALCATPAAAGPFTGGGQTIINNSVSQTQASSSPQSGTTSGSAGVWTTLLSSSGTRKGCSFTNTSASLIYIFVGGGTPTVATSYALNPATSNAAGGFFSCTSGNLVITDTLQISSTGISSTYAGNTQ